MKNNKTKMKKYITVKISKNTIILVVFVLILGLGIMTVSASGRFNLPLSWILSPSGTTVDSDNDGIIDNSDQLDSEEGTYYKQNLSDVLTQSNSAASTTITGLPTPAAASQAATKQYVDDNAGGSYQVPKTGQTTSYDTGDADDGYYEKGCALSYTDNGDGTVTDNCTSLMWKLCSEPDTATATCGGTHSTYTWENALARCEGLDYGGHTDWRLPNAKELWSITSLEPGSAPYINQTAFPGTVSSYYWSSTTYPYGTDRALIVYFYRGSLLYASKTLGYYVRCVRG